MQIRIYALINPIIGDVFYVGATSDKLYTRLSGHLSCKYNSRKYALISKIKDRGLRPEILLLDTVDHNEAGFFEQFYMDLFRSFGFNLLNRRKSNYTKLYGELGDSVDELYKPLD